MSSGVEADIVLDAAVIATLGLNRVLGGAAGLAGSGAQALAALAEGKAEARAAALAEAERYAGAVHAAIERNARIAALAESGRRTTGGDPVVLPAPLAPAELADRSEAELAAWCAETDAALARAESTISANLAADLAGRIFALPAGSLSADLGVPTGRDGDATGVPDPAGSTDQAAGRAGDQTADHAADQAADLPTETAQHGSAHHSAHHSERVRALARVLSRLPADTAEADVRHVAAAAERLAGAATAGEAEGLLNEVRLRVQAAAHRARERRAELRRLAAERDAREQAEAERRYVLDTVTAAFTELGYEVDTGFETLSPRDGAVVLTRGDRPDHAVKMRVDETATLRAALVRTRTPDSEEERRLDVEREREWCESFEAARRRLEEAGVRSAVTWRVEPGDQALPVSPEARHTRARTRQRERERQRARETEA